MGISRFIKLFNVKAGKILSKPSLIYLKAREHSLRLTDGRSWVHFLHIGKTGGTALKSAIRSGGESSEDIALGDENICTPTHRIILHNHNASLKDVPKGDKFFFFVRDPIERFVSGFYSRKRKGRPRYFSTWSDDEKKAFERFETPNELALSLSSGDLEEEKIAAHAMKSIEHVGDMYSEWYESKEYFLSRLSDAIMVGRTENLDRHFPEIKKVLSLSDNATLPTSEEKAHKNPYSELNTYLEKEARINLKKWYREDFEFLSMCKKNHKKIGYPHRSM